MFRLFDLIVSRCRLDQNVDLYYNVTIEIDNSYLIINHTYNHIVIIHYTINTHTHTQIWLNRIKTILFLEH